MEFPHPIQVDAEAEVGGWLKFVQALFQQDAVGAEVDETFCGLPIPGQFRRSEDAAAVRHRELRLPGAPHSSTALKQSSGDRFCFKRSRWDAEFCRSRNRPGCSETAVPASAPGETSYVP